ncbi:MAG: Flp family type IVb pilin [Planctomycetaceae bacterium]|nr:Flp family type IVb pilin [Planctomycetaceae bacterium]MCA9029401.1 Flp family type IVb pilin [Planctomycetaceae bacterium]MCB9953749.1 Flp family type IVb pilin [Planctomycetaceae bacterium]
MIRFTDAVKNFLQEEDGPTAVEYAVMLALIVIVCLTAIRAVGTATSSNFNNIANELNSAQGVGGSVGP